MSKFFLRATFISSEEIILYFVIFVLFQTQLWQGETLNLKSMTGKASELVDMMDKTKVDLLCVQNTR